MKAMKKADMKTFLNKSWMTHDAMWFRYCLLECGIEKTNRISKAAIKAMAQVEIKGMMALFGVPKVDNFKGLKQLLKAAFDLIRADFMDFEYSYPEENTLLWKMNRCFTHDNIKEMGATEHYQCGLFERPKGWFEGIGIRYTVRPEVNGCMLVKGHNCFREFHFYFD
jgi:hypothetical protein